MKSRMKKWLPSPKSIGKNPKLKSIVKYLDHSSLWSFSKHSVSKSIAIGLFINFLPIPFQMLWAALLSLYFSANLPLAIALTWLNNPLTFIPINFFMYKVGSLILFQPAHNFSFPELNVGQGASLGVFFRELFMWFGSIGKAYLLGVAIVSIGAAFWGYVISQVIWSVGIYIKARNNKGKRLRRTSVHKK